MPPLHALPIEQVAREVGSDPERGLTEDEAAERLRLGGPNVLERGGRPPYVQIAIRQVSDPLVALLLVAAIVSAVVGEGLEAGVIAAIVLLNGALGFAEELGAERAVLALRESVPRQVAVVRAGLERLVAAEEIVQGDLVVLREGERVPADARLVTGGGLAVDESPLTGESIPVQKCADLIAAEAPLAERSAMVLSLIHKSEPTRQKAISYSGLCL
jgi:magnesium-transporting ATPase (P-type)